MPGSARSARATVPNWRVPSRSSSMRHRATGPRKTLTAIEKFRDAIAEGAEIVNTDREKACGVDREIHQAADRTGQGVTAEPVRAGAEGRTTRLVDRCHVVAENAADQARSQETDPELDAAGGVDIGANRSSRSAGDRYAERTRSEPRRARHHCRPSAPGARLGIVDLVQRYEIGATPLREGLSRLVSRGLIVGIGQRGFRVAEVSREDLLISRGCAPWSRSRRCGSPSPTATMPGRPASSARCIRCAGTSSGRRNEFREGATDFDRLHKAFHTSLLAACGSKRLLTAHSDLYDQAYRYRRVMMRGVDSGKKFVAAHQNLADRILARDADGAQAMLAAHLRSTLDFVYPQGKGDRS